MWLIAIFGSGGRFFCKVHRVHTWCHFHVMPTFLQEERRRPSLGTGGFVPKRWIARAGQAGGDDTRRQGTVDLENHLGQGFETTMINRGLMTASTDP